MSDNAIEVREVSKRFRLYHERNQSLKQTILNRSRGTYEELWALRNVSFEVPEGTTFGLIGHNGSGKSTMLKILAKILRPDEGGMAVRGKTSALLELGAGFHHELSGRENIFLNGSILGLSKRELERKLDDIVSFAGLERFIDMPVKNYSSGMYVRLGFSVAINVDPDVLLVDEVLAVGDEEFQRRCLGRVDELRAAGKTIVVVTHSLATVRTLCDAAAWLERGQVRALGDASDVTDAYLGEVHTDLQTLADEDRSQGRGSPGEVMLTDIQLLGADGQVTHQVSTGDTVTFRLHYEAPEPTPRPVFSLSIYTLDGALVTGPNTKESGVTVDKVDGKGTVDLTVPRLLLLLGSYDVSAECTNASVSHSYGRLDRALRFDVKPGTPHETFGGIVSLDGRFTIS